jgi:lipid-A-disaccharide synthase
VEFVGHPLIDLAKATESRASFLASQGLQPDAPTIALLPGSRPNELHAILPGLMAATTRIRARVPRAQFVLARAPRLTDALLEPAMRMRTECKLPLAIVEGRADDVLASSDVVLTASGTATVQTALHERPMVIVYRLSPLTYTIGRPFVKIDTFGMVNLVSGKRIVPELIQDGFTPDTAAAEVINLLLNPSARDTMIGEIRDVKRKLGGPGASGRAAEAIVRVARERLGGTQ